MIVTAKAPIRLCDCGGWTDTWFARHGCVVNIAALPRAVVRIEAFPASPARPPLLLDVRDFGYRYAPALVPGRWGRHPLLEAAIVHVGIPDHMAIEASITCPVPPGAGTGTSAAVSVALVAALDRLNGGSMAPREVARTAHAVEAERLGLQSGIQDQISAALGGINAIHMTEYPAADVERLPVEAGLRAELERRLSVVFLGRGHRSSDIHQLVIASLAGLGADCAPLADLRRAAAGAARAIVTSDLAAFGRAMQENTEAQRRLHPALVCADADAVIALADERGAAGWKVNGAGGDGGSLTLLGPSDVEANGAMLAAIGQRFPAFGVMPVTLDHEGVMVECA